MPREGGLIIQDGREIATTYNCPHCNLPYRLTKETAKKQKWCKNCGANTCGLPGCHECIPFGKKIENFEKRSSDGLILP